VTTKATARPVAGRLGIDDRGGSSVCVEARYLVLSGVGNLRARRT
jgi:hypothetical protein